MEMKLDPSKSPDLPGVLLITEERTEQLHIVIEQEYFNIRNNPHVLSRLTEVYQRIAGICDNVNEYAFCMHVLLFNLANIGAPRDSAKLQN